MPADFNSLPLSIQKQLDGVHIVCSWWDWINHYETILAIQPNVRVKLLDWPEIVLGESRVSARRAISGQFPGIRIELPDKEIDGIDSRE